MRAHGDAHWTRQAPERVLRGESHWMRRMPELIARGMGHGCAKLTDDIVRAIREARTHGATLEKLGDQHGITKTQISRIVRRKSWAHIA
jgi:hypothetical protein